MCLNLNTERYEMLLFSTLFADSYNSQFTVTMVNKPLLQTQRKKKKTFRHLLPAKDSSDEGDYKGRQSHCPKHFHCPPPHRVVQHAFNSPDGKTQQSSHKSYPLSQVV